MTDCWIALGGNMGDVARTFHQALNILDKAPGVAVVKHSRNYTTSPVGTNAGDRFINAAAQLQVECSPVELLDLLQDVELQLGRVRQLRWGPRTLDLDLLLCEQQVLITPRLTIPHPLLWFRRFVLDPLAEIAADVQHPRFGISISELRDLLLVRPLPCCILGGDSHQRSALQQQMSEQFPETSWQESLIGSGGLAFCLDRASANFARAIDLSPFPTPPAETITDILHAALDSARVIDE